jgi:murein L,D-transpeptidase YafK
MYIAVRDPSAYNSHMPGKCLFSRKIMVFRRVLATLVLGFAAFVAEGDTLPQAERVMLRSTESLPAVDRVVVHKTDRRLVLMHGETVVRSYKIALGLNPVGQKERSGDFRTPEGRYFLVRRNPRSDFFLSIQVSYPNETDLKRARRNHWDAGGSIMIHGLPNQLKHEPAYYESRDWTDGCIALSNADMVEVWLLTPDNVPIDILP